MSNLLVLLIVLHVLSGVFWAGSTFVLARTAGANVERLAFPQLGAAVATIIMGASVWALALRNVPPIPALHVLGAGAMCALLAAIVQGSALPVVRRLKNPSTDPSAARRRITIHQRVASVLLAAAIVGMVLWGKI